MKYAHQLLASLAAFSLLFMVSCGGGDDSPTPGENGENPGAALIGTWVQDEAGDIVVPDDSGIEFENFSITITASDDPNTLNYSATNTQPLVFPQTGTFTNIPDDANFSTGVQVLRGDQLPVTMTLVSDEELRMEFSVSGDSGIPTDNSRVAQTIGDYTFNLTKQQ